MSRPPQPKSTTLIKHLQVQIQVTHASPSSIIPLPLLPRPPLLKFITRQILSLCCLTKFRLAHAPHRHATRGGTSYATNTQTARARLAPHMQLRQSGAAALDIFLNLRPGFCLRLRRVIGPDTAGIRCLYLLLAQQRGLVRS